MPRVPCAAAKTDSSHHLETWTLHGSLWVSCGVWPGMMVVDPLGPVGCWVGPWWIKLVPGQIADAQLEWNLGNLEVR